MFLSENYDQNQEIIKNKTKKISKNYFDVREEDAVKQYILSDCKEEKEEILNKINESLDMFKRLKKYN